MVAGGLYPPLAQGCFKHILSTLSEWAVTNVAFRCWHCAFIAAFCSRHSQAYMQDVLSALPAPQPVVLPALRVPASTCAPRLPASPVQWREHPCCTGRRFFKRSMPPHLHLLCCGLLKASAEVGQVQRVTRVFFHTGSQALGQMGAQL